MAQVEAKAEAGHEAEAERVHWSRWPPMAALGVGVFFGLLALAFSFQGLLLRVGIVAGGLALFLAGALGWLREDIRRPSRAVFGASEVSQAHPQRVSVRKVGMWFFLASEIAFFSGIIGTSFALRTRTAAPWPHPGVILNVPLTGLNTFILIVSSLTMVEALAAIEKGDQRRLRIFLLATLLLGCTFVSIQAFEYNKLFHEGLTPTAAPLGAPAVYGTTFYIQTGFHGAHVSGGIVAMAYVTLRAFRGGFSKENHEAVELMGLYWHFVDVVWIFLFTIVYLI